MTEQHVSQLLERDLGRVIEDTEHFLSDLKGHRSIKKLVKKDVTKLRDHLYRLLEHVEQLEENHT